MGRKIKKVFICSPYKGGGESEDERQSVRNRNILLARQACRFALDQGCIPYAPHLYYTQFLEDTDADERKMGMVLGLSWLTQCDELWVIGRRITEGMRQEIRKAREWRIPVEHYIEERSTEQRLMDAILFPRIVVSEMSTKEGE